jgi:hypothetical protein
MSLAARVALQKAEPVLVHLVDELRGRVESGELTAQFELFQAVQALVAVVGATAPGSSGELVTTRQLSERFGLSVKTILRHKKNGTITPVLQRGKLIRWSGSETL